MCYNINMNKKSLLSLCVFGASTVLSFVTIHIMQLICTNKWVGVSVALVLFAVMLIMLVIITKKAEKYMTAARFVAIGVNAIADGLALSSFFTYVGGFPKVWQSVVAVVVLVGIFALYFPITYLSFVRNHYKISMLLYVLAVIGVGVTVCATATRAIVGISLLVMLYVIIFIAFFISLADRAHNAEEHIETMTYSSFAGVLVAFIVLAIISESDADFLSGADASGIGGTTNAYRKRNPYEYLAYEYIAANALTHIIPENPNPVDNPEK